MKLQALEGQTAFDTYDEAIAWIHSLVTGGIKPGLKRMEAMMEAFGNPQRRLKFIHVAGTNGKGSTCAMLEKVLSLAGYHVGMFTSPYLEQFTNRIKSDGKDIPQSEVLRLTNMLKPLADELKQSELGQPTMFEIVTAMAILYFAKTEYPDYVIWETGLGGRLDSTNIVVPVLSVITNIGHDHMDLLGETLPQIAAEKAGIIKPGVPVVTTATQPEVLEVLRQTAQDNQATLYVLNQQFSIDNIRKDGELEGHAFDYSGPFRTLNGLHCSLTGIHQVQNAAAALMTLEVLRQYMALILEDEDVYAAFKQIKWAGRMELVKMSPRFLLDGAHNPEGAEALASAITAHYQYRKLNLLIGMLSVKNHKAYFRHILPIVDTLIITEPEFRNPAAAKWLWNQIQPLWEEMKGSGTSVRVIVEPDWKLALDQLNAMTADEDLAVITGSLYLVSDVRSQLLGSLDSEKGW